MTQIKQPAEKLIFEYDFAPRIGTGRITAIVSVGITPRGQVAVVLPLVAASQQFAGQTVRLQLEGGTDGEVYLVIVRAADAAGQVHELEADFTVINFGFAVPDLVTPYLSAQAFVERLGLDDAIRITDTVGTGRIETARLARALADAQAEVDGYLAVKYLTPLAVVPPLIATLVFDLAVARLWRGELPGSVADRRDAAQRQLRDLAKGLITVPGAAGLTVADASVTPVLFSAPERRFTRSTMTGL